MNGFFMSLSGGSDIPPILSTSDTQNWYDFLDLTTITKDGSDLVSSVTDKSLSGRTLTATTTQRPTYTSDGMSFNGTSNRLKTANYTTSGKQRVYLVFKQRTWTANDIIFDGRDTNTFIQQLGTTPNLVMRGDRYSSQYNGLALDSWKVLVAHFDNANALTSYLRVDSNKQLLNPGPIVAGGFTLGSLGSNSLFSDILVKGLIITNGLETVDVENDIINYLKEKYNV